MSDNPAIINRQMTENDWREIVYSIQNEKCILVLGPGAVLNPESVPLLDQMVKRIAQIVGEDTAEHYSDSFLTLSERLMKERGGRAQLSEILNETFKKTPVHPMIMKLARVPFHLIISTSPDHLLKKAFEKSGIPHDFSYYNYNKLMQVPERKEDPTPLIYNLFGSIEDENSLIRTHEDLFDFIFEILGTKKMADRVREDILSAYNFVFLGFNFESWYLKIILRLLESHTKEVSYAYPWKSGKLSESTKMFFEDNFRLDFVNNEISAFIDDLYNRSEERGLLREINIKEEDESLLEKVRDLIGKDEIDNAIDEIETALSNQDDDDLLNDLYQMSGRYSRLMRAINKGTIAQADANVELNQITDALLNLAEEAS